MSQRYGIAGQQYLDNNGNPLSGGKLNFYETGTETPKDTYTTSAESVANANPVVLDQYGRQGDIWFTGLAKVVLTDSDDVEIDTTDPVGSAGGSGGSGWADYSSSTTYDAGDIVVASNGRYYRSISGSNLNNEPSTSATVWEEFIFTGIWNTNVTYIDDAVVLYEDVLYISLAGSNSGNQPDTSPAFWRTLAGGLSHDTTPKTSSFTASFGTHYLIDTSGGAFTMTYPAGVVGQKVGFTDYGESFGTNILNIAADGSEEILNDTGDHSADITGLVGVMIYTADRGWVYT